MPLLEAECLKEAQARGVTLPPEWPVQAVVEKFREAVSDVQPAVLKVAAKLRDNGRCCLHPPLEGSQLLLDACSPKSTQNSGISLH